MCGIFFSLSTHEHILPTENLQQRLRARGPDHHDQHLTTITSGGPGGTTTYYAAFVSTVLSLRGQEIVKQPLKDAESGAVLCWNGEAWSIHGSRVSGNDSVAVFKALQHAASANEDASRDVRIRALNHALNGIRGPYSFVFYSPKLHCIFYGRDCLGRRSLLQETTRNDTLILSSVGDSALGDRWVELEAANIYHIDLDGLPAPDVVLSTRVPTTSIRSTVEVSHFVPSNTSERPVTKVAYEEAIRRLSTALTESLSIRVQHVREAVKDHTQSNSLGAETRIAILFSGGLDCTILARLAHELLPPDEPIDLLNVAFENPRLRSQLNQAESPYELCPDRISGRVSHTELSKVCPGRLWRFVEISVPYHETVQHRAKIIALMSPHNTEMDLSISLALYFAARGVGAICHSDGVAQPYTSTARVLLSGLGADELFGGYQRHATAFSRRSYAGLVEELELDFTRLGQRNLGRDDRVISDSGKEVRFPYLDEHFVNVALQLPVMVKCDFGIPQGEQSENAALLLEPGKRILRALAWDLGMKRVAMEKKRAIQFGARTAKMETGRSKGTQLLA